MAGTSGLGLCGKGRQGDPESVPESGIPGLSKGKKWQIGVCLTGMSYGACPTITAAFTSSYFGMKYFSNNMALMTFTVMIGSFVANASNRVLEVTGGYTATFIMLLALTFSALILNAFIRKP